MKLIFFKKVLGIFLRKIFFKKIFTFAESTTFLENNFLNIFS